MMRFVLPLAVALASLAGPALAHSLGEPPDLVIAAKDGDLGLAKDAFIRHDDPDVGDDDGNTPLYFAIKNHHVALVQALLEHHATPTRTGAEGKFPLLWAAEQGDAEIVQALLKAGAKPDQAAKDGTTALMAAAAAGNDDAVLALLAGGATVGLVDYTGRDAIGWALDSHRTRVAQILRAAESKHRPRRLSGPARGRGRRRPARRARTAPAGRSSRCR